MAGNDPGQEPRSGRIIPFPAVRRPSLGLTLLEFAHTLVLMLWIGTLAGLALVVTPVLFSHLPDRETAASAVLAILEQTAFLGCGAGAFLLLTTLLMQLLSLRRTRASIVQMVLILAMTGLAVTSQLVLNPKLHAILTSLEAPLSALPADDPARAAFGRLFDAAIGVNLLQIAAGIGVLFFAVRRWYRYLPLRRATGPIRDDVSDPPLR